MAWLSLFLAGLLEAFGVTMISRLHKNRDWQTIVLLILGFGSSLVLLGYSLRFIPMGTGYAIWTGIGVIGGALAGILFYDESKEAKRIVFMALILLAAIGLKLVS